MTHLHEKFAHLKKEYDAVVQCNRCGFCETVCPTYVSSGKEDLSPRGRNQMFRGILEGKLADPKLASDIFTTCLTCHACTNVCFSQVPVARLMGYARELSNSTALKNPLLKFLLRTALTHRKILSLILWPVFLVKRLKISALLNKTGLLKKLLPALSAGEELIDSVPLKFGPEARAHASSTTYYFSGCGTHYLYPSAAESCLKVMENSGEKVSTVEHPCCGLMLFTAGDTDGAKSLALKNLRLFQSLGAKALVTNDDSCCGFLKDYPKLLSGLAPENELQSFAQTVQNLSTHCPKSADKSKSAPRTVTVTYHDPCQMGNAHHILQEPRDLIRSIPGVKYVELNESNWCCGGAGTFCLKHPSLADDVLARKLENIEKTGAEIVVTQAASCLMHIGYGLRKKAGAKQVRIMHLAEFLREYGNF